jgi:prepilin-type N-terminal cleavage/methylation domain-containing protein
MGRLGRPPRGAAGFTLIELLIVSGVAGVLSLIMGQVFIYSQRVMESQLAASDFINLANSIRIGLTRKADCVSALSPSSFSGGQPTKSLSQFTLNTVGTIAVGQALQGTRLIAEAIELQDLSCAVPAAAGVSCSSSAKLYVRF